MQNGGARDSTSGWIFTYSAARESLSFGGAQLWSSPPPLGLFLNRLLNYLMVLQNWQIFALIWYEFEVCKQRKYPCFFPAIKTDQSLFKLLINANEVWIHLVRPHPGVVIIIGIYIHWGKAETCVLNIPPAVLVGLIRKRNRESQIDEPKTKFN